MTGKHRKPGFPGSKYSIDPDIKCTENPEGSGVSAGISSDAEGAGENRRDGRTENPWVRAQKRRNPLRRRYLRELRSEFGKYLVIFLLLVFTIGFISGFLVADGSMLIAYNDSFEKYNIEDGNFRTDEEISKSNRRDIEELGVTLFDNFYIEKSIGNGSVLRVFQNREEVNLLCLMKGKFPEKPGEMVLDRMYAENNGIEVGDRIRFGGCDFEISGFAAFPDYSALFRDNNDTMFDAVKFGVAAVAKEDFERFPSDESVSCYSWKYKTPPSSTEEEKEMSDSLMEDIAEEVYVEDFIPAYLNQAIQFTGEDMGGDRAMMLILLYIVIAIIAFVFVITINDTIAREAPVIGTLRATGYTRAELVRHYMTLPLLVTAAAALVGNILGYTYFKYVCVGMYYGSYSLPTYVTVWNAEAFKLTTVVPCVIMAVTTFLTLWHKLSLSPLQFLRRELRKHGRSRAVRLSARIPFFARFRLRVFFQNIGNYVILLIGILFANLLLLFGMALPVVLDRYQESMKDNMLCNYQYYLKAPAYHMDRDYEMDKILSSSFLRLSTMTSNKDAEPFSSYTLKIPEGEALRVENISVYGVRKDSRYVKAPIARGEVWISSAFADKCKKSVGDTLHLREPYEDKYYDFKVDGIYNYEGALCMFMRREDLTKTFGLFEDYTAGYFSDSEITDISRDYIASVVDYDALIKISRQLDVSMGGMMIMVDIFAVVLFMILIYLLSRIIIEKNAQPISMTKILGYSDREIARIYIVTTTIVTLITLACTIPVENVIMKLIFRNYLAARMTGWITYDIPFELFIKMFLIGAATYLAVAAFEIRKIRAIPMADALKDVM